MSRPFRKMSAFLVVASLFCLVTVGNAALAGLQIDGKEKVSFHATGPAGFKIVGKTNQIQVEEREGGVVFTVPVASVKTGIKLRDRHMRDKYVEVSKYPNVTLQLSIADIRLPASAGETIEAQASGVFQIHGKSSQVIVSYIIKKKKKKKFLLEGSFSFNTEEHGIKIPSYLGITVDPDMRAEAKFLFVNE